MEKELIQFIKNNEFLYNKNHYNYRNMYLRNQKFIELSRKLKIPTNRLKNRWRTLRDNFRKESRICVENGVTPKKKWKWLDHLIFLNETDTTDETSISIYSTKDTPLLNSMIIKHESSPTPSIDSTTAIDSIFLDRDCGITNLSINNPMYNELTPSSSIANTKSRVDASVESVNNEMMQLIEIIKNTLAAPKAQSTQNASVKMFFESIALQVEDACISPQEFGNMQIQILKIVNGILYKKT